MKTRDLTELAAIPVVVVILGALALIMLAFDAGVWAWLLVGVAGAVVAALVVWVVATRRLHPAPSAAPPTHRRRMTAAQGSTRRVLVVADDCATSDAFVSAVVAHAGGSGRDGERRGDHQGERLRGGENTRPAGRDDREVVRPGRSGNALQRPGGGQR